MMQWIITCTCYFLRMGVCMCVCVRGVYDAFMRSYVCLCLCMQMPEENVWCIPLWISALLPWDKNSHWIWSLTFWLDCLSNECLITTHICLSRLELQACISTQGFFFMWVLNIWTQVLMLVQDHSYSPSYLMSHCIPPLKLGCTTDGLRRGAQMI